MKKKLGYLFLLLLVGLLLAYIIRYKTGPCICDTIPKNAEAAMLINVRNLENHIFLDALSHPSSFFSSGKSSTAKDTSKRVEAVKKEEKSIASPSIMSCISMPKAVVMYKTDDNDGRWHSSKIVIKNRAKLDAFLKANGFQAISQNDVFSKGLQHVIIEGDKLQVAYGSVVASGKAPTENTYMKKGDLIFDALSSCEDDAIYVDNKGRQLQLNFSSGALQINGKYHVDALQPSTQVSTGEGIGGFFATLDVSKLSDMLSSDQKSSFSNFTKLHMDSLALYWDGNFSGLWHGMTVSADTIKTYDYDDDFNKIEIKKVQEVVEPEYGVKLGMSSSGEEYLKRKKAIVSEEGKDVFALMPLTKTYSRMKDESLYLYTKENEIELRPSEHKLSFFLDAQKYNESSAKGFMPFFEKMEKLESISLQIANDDSVTGRIAFDGNRNALVTMMGRK